MPITSGQQYNVEEKPTVILYIYINRHVVVVVVVFTLNRSDLYPVPFSFLLFKAKKRISVVTR